MNTCCVNLRKLFMTNVKCSECNQPEPTPWYEQPMNEEIRETARTYISPVKMFYEVLDQALEIWGENFETTNH